MYLDSSILIAFAILCILVLLATTAAVLGKLRRERGRRLQLTAREEYLAREVAALEQTCERLRNERGEAFAANRELSFRISSLQAALDQADKQEEKQNALLETTRREMEKDFRILAEQVFRDKNKTIGARHLEDLQTLLSPVREQLADFRKKVEDVYDRESRDRVSLVKEIEHLKKLNLQISEDAVSLANALKGQSKVQGLWGEMVLERLLENCGLQRGREFDTQVRLDAGGGRSRFPDVLVRLPRGRTIVIDAKVSLKAFEKACRTEKEEERGQQLQAHLDSIKRHVTGLAAREYHLLEGLDSLDYVILFLPTEGAFQAAVSLDPDLIGWTMERKIVLASPSTLLAILRTVNHMWRQEDQTRNSLAIAKQAGSLYDKFTGFVEVFEEIGSRLQQAGNAWETARKRLATGRGNLISRAEMLKELGVQSSKTLPSSVSSRETEQDEDPAAKYDH